MARPQGLEPRLLGSEPNVLPLHHGRITTDPLSIQIFVGLLEAF